MAYDPALDYTFYCQNNNHAGQPTLTISLTGSRLEACIVDDTSVTLTLTPSGSNPTEGYFNVISNAVPTITLSAEGTMYPVDSGSASSLGAKWVWWSNIGEMDFTMGEDNVAGEMPMQVEGWVYCIKKLGNIGVMVYSENGISLMPAAENPRGQPTYGYRIMSRVGLKSKNSITGTDNIHWCIDAEGKLWRITEKGMELLDYREYLAPMSVATVMSYDEHNDLVYIADGTYGFVLSKDGLGKAPANISGFGVKDGSEYPVAPAAITNAALSISSDIFDLGTRTEKIIYGVQVGTDTTKVLQVALDYRLNKASAFTASSWVTTDEKGIAHFMITCVEFRVKVKITTYEYIEIDHINVFGQHLEKRGVI